jgi:chromosome segregation ATPase
MSDSESKLKELQTRLAGLDTEIQELTARLEEKRAAQAAAILEGKDTSDIEAEIMNLKTKLAGTRRAHEKQTQSVNDLWGQRKSELQKVGRAQTEQTKAESLAIAAAIARSILEGAGQVATLKVKIAEFTSAVRSAGLKSGTTDQILNQLRKMQNLVYHLENEFPKVLKYFPDEMYADEDLISLKDLSSPRSVNRIPKTKAWPLREYPSVDEEKSVSMKQSPKP